MTTKIGMLGNNLQCLLWTPQRTSKVRLIYWIQNTPNIFQWVPSGFHLKGLKLWTKKLGCQQVIIVVEGKKYQNKTHSGKR